MSDLFDVRIERHGGTVRISLIGELDIASAPELHRRMADARRTADGDVVVDVGALGFACLRGIQALVVELKALRRSNEHVAVVNVQPSIHRTASLIHLDSQLAST